MACCAVNLCVNLRCCKTNTATDKPAWHLATRADLAEPQQWTSAEFGKLGGWKNEMQLVEPSCSLWPMAWPEHDSFVAASIENFA